MKDAATPTPPAKKAKVSKAKKKPGKTAAAAKTTKPTQKPRKSPKRCVHFSQAIADEIAVRTSLGESLRTIAADETMPTMRAIVGWQREHPTFAAQLDEARKARADARIEEISDISAKVLRGEIDPHAARVGLENLWKLAGREHWARWGEKQALAVAVQTSTYDEAAGERDSTARVEWLRRLRQLAERSPHYDPRKSLMENYAVAVSCPDPSAEHLRTDNGVILPPDPPSKDIVKATNPEPWQPPGDDSKLVDVTPRPPIEHRGEAPAKGRAAAGHSEVKPTEKREFYGLKCEKGRAEFLDRRDYWPEVITSRRPFGRG